MANTYTQIHIQVVFTVQNRESLIRDEWKEELYKYLTGIIQKKGHKVLQINGMPDHIHILIGLRPIESISQVMKTVKGESSTWINNRGFVKGRFSWQEGYGAFSYSRSEVPAVISYIQNQEKHHQKTGFIEEYKKMLEEFEIDFNDIYIFTEV